MGKYSVPESIRQMKPKGTMVKCISGHYYVYEYSTVTGADGCFCPLRPSENCSA